MITYLSKQAQQTSVVEYHLWPYEELTVMSMSTAAVGRYNTVVNYMAQKLVLGAIFSYRTILWLLLAHQFLRSMLLFVMDTIFHSPLQQH